VILPFQLIDDAIFENSEDFYVLLSDPGPNTALGAIVRVKIIISGPNDVSLIYFSQEEYLFNENSGTQSEHLKIVLALLLLKEVSVFVITADNSK
jgi:hypothetical protein